MSAISRFGEPVARLSPEARVKFYELLAHELTIGIRDVWASEELSADEKVDQLKWINEIMHRVVRKITYEREATLQWLDTDLQDNVAHWVSQNPRIAPIINYAINRSYKYVIGES